MSTSEVYAEIRAEMQASAARRERALDEVRAERERQDAKWGTQTHGPEVWLAILVEEVGELAEAILVHRNPGDDRNGTHCEDMRSEATQIAAVAVQFLEYLDRMPGGRA